MKNSFSTANLNLIRTRPQSADWYLAIHRPRVMGEFTITNQTNYAGSVIAELGVLGTNPSSALADQTGIVYDTNGNWMGDIRIRKTWPGNGSVISIAEAGSGLIDWQSSSTMKVIDQYRPWLKHPRYNSATSQWMMDFDVAYSGQMSQWGPYANPGTPIIALPASSGKWVVDFVGSDSFSLQTSITSASWIFPDGQTVTSGLGTETSPIKMTFTGASPGGSYFSLTVVDTNAGSHTGRRLIFTVNDISQFPAVQVSTISGGVEPGGYQAQFMATGNPVSQITEANYPYLDNSELVVFEQARYGGTRASFGGNAILRGDTIFRGWISGKEMRVSPFSSDMMITAETVNGIANQGDSYDVFLANFQSGASAWTEISSLKLDSVTQFMLKWRSTLGVICDWTPMFGLGNSEEIIYQSLPRSGLFDQIKSNYYDRGVLGYFASDMQSNLFAFQDMQLAGSSTGGSVALLHQDKRDAVTISSVPRDDNAQVTLYAVASDVPYGAESPAHVRGYFGGERVHEKGLLVDSQQRLIDWTGNFRAKLNNRYPRINVPMANNMRIDPVPQSIVSMSMAASENARGITWNSDKFVTKELNVSYDSVVGYPLFDIGFEKYTQGIGGSSITFPTVGDIVPIPTNPPPPGYITPPYTPPVTVGFGTGFGTVYAMTRTVLGRTRAFSAASPTWTNVTPSGIGNMYDYILDPWNPDDVGFCFGQAGVYRSMDLTQGSPSWTNILTEASVKSATGVTTFINQYAKIMGSINVDQYLAIFWLGDSVELYCSYTNNSKATTPSWNHVHIATTAGVAGFGWAGGADIVPHLVGGSLVLYCIYGISTGGTGGSVVCSKSTNGGASWTKVGTLTAIASNKKAFSLHSPYSDNTAGNYLAGMVYTDTGSGRGIYVSVDGGINWTNEQSGDYYEITRWGAETYTMDRQIGYYVLGAIIYTSDDYFNNATAATMTGLSGNITATGGFPTQSSQFYALTTKTVSGGIYVSIDRGENWIDKTGNFRTMALIGSVDAFSSIPAVIVPLWTE